MLLKKILANDVKKVKKMLDEDASAINQLNNVKGSPFCVPVTPLMLATELNHEEIVALLLSYGADVNFPVEGGKTPIFSAQNQKVASLLVENGADIEVFCQDDKYNAVMLMLITGHLEAAEYLLSLGSFPKHWSQYYLFSTCEEHATLIGRYFNLDERVGKKEDVKGIMHMIFDFMKYQK